ncbi:MAG: hypothetical protein KDC49_00935 [Saprospiraceae bacterium]|nr:hypothetical protein [Saprospiraceae bacterium]
MVKKALDGADLTGFSPYILLGKWIDHFNCENKKSKFKAENADGVGTPARLSNAEICFFGSNLVVKSISE